MTDAPRQQLTAVQQRALEIDAARGHMLADVEANRTEIAQFLKGFGIEYDFFVSGLKVFLMRQAQTQPDFFTTVTPASFMEALFRCAKDGLIPDGKEAAIATFKGAATYIPMRDGLVKILWRTGQIKDLNDQVVTKAEYDEGRFEYEEGSNGYIRHRPALDRKDSDMLVAAYCVVNLVNGGSVREVVMQADLTKITIMSRSPAMKTWGHQMSRKAAIRRVMGKMPRDPHIANVLAHDDENYELENLSARLPPEQSGVADRLKAGGSPDAPGFAHSNVETALPALSAPSDTPMEIASPDIGEREYAETAEIVETGDAPDPVLEAKQADDVRADMGGEGVPAASVPSFDPLQWAADYNRALAEWFDPDALATDWKESFDKRKKLDALSPGTAATLKNEVAARIAELGGVK